MGTLIPNYTCYCFVLHSILQAVTLYGVQGVVGSNPIAPTISRYELAPWLVGGGLQKPPMYTNLYTVLYEEQLFCMV